MAANYIEDFDYGLDVMEQKPERKLEVRYSVWNARGARWQYKNRRMVADKLIRAASRKAKK